MRSQGVKNGIGKTIIKVPKKRKLKNGIEGALLKNNNC